MVLSRFQRPRQQEAEIGRTGRGRFRLGIEGAVGLVQIDLLASEMERDPALAEALDVHAERARV